MYQILVVDDEKIEREGIRFLIEEFNLPLQIVEAVNGKAALLYLQQHEVDILWTDIKMPFMEGIELAEKAKQLQPNLKIVIFSAYGEFDYAKKAIQINVNRYILKPIVVEEFLNTAQCVIELCERDRLEQAREKELLQSYQKSIMYDNEKKLLDLLNGALIDDELSSAVLSLGFDFLQHQIQIVLIDFKSRFFDMHHDSFRQFLESCISCDYEYINLNEHQSVVFLKLQKDDLYKEHIRVVAESIINGIQEKFGLDACIVIGRPVSEAAQIHAEYINLEQLLDYKFFVNRSMVLVAGEAPADGEIVHGLVESIVESVYKSLELADLHCAEQGIRFLFDCIREQRGISVLYIKYICTEIVKKAYENCTKSASIPINKIVDNIFNSRSLQQLNEQVTSFIACLKDESSSLRDEFNRKVIKDVMNIIQSNYMNDISLESIASQVYLSSGYLSGLFKKHTGQSLIKYITMYRLEKAKEKLQKTNMKIVDIAEQVGYSNVSYFCMTFRNYTGVTPARFRGREESQ